MPSALSISCWCAALILLSSSSALAQDPAPVIEQAPLPDETPPPPPPPVVDAPPPPVAPALPPTFSDDAPGAGPERLDMMLPMSAGSLILGASLLLGGGLTFASISTDEYCGITGCTNRPNPLEVNIGASLVGAGLGFAVVGGFGMLGWAVNRPTGTETRESEKLMSVGFGAVSLAGASLGLGIAQTLTYDDRSTNLTTAWPFFLTSGVLSAVGIPLLVVGADIETDADREADRQHAIAMASPDAPKGMYSPGMVIGGSIMTGLGGLAGLAGTTMIILDAAAWQSGFVTLIIGLPLLGGGGLFSAIGIPLIAVGTKKDVKKAEMAVDWVPTVDVGPAGLRASWGFE